MNNLKKFVTFGILGVFNYGFNLIITILVWNDIVCNIFFVRRLNIVQSIIVAVLITIVENWKLIELRFYLKNPTFEYLPIKMIYKLLIVIILFLIMHFGIFIGG